MFKWVPCPRKLLLLLPVRSFIIQTTLPQQRKFPLLEERPEQQKPQENRSSLRPNIKKLWWGNAVRIMWDSWAEDWKKQNNPNRKVEHRVWDWNWWARNYLKFWAFFFDENRHIPYFQAISDFCIFICFQWELMMEEIN